MYITALSGLEQEGAVIDIERAVRLNRYYGRRLRWEAQQDRILRLLGFHDPDPDESTFAKAVARWQADRQGLTPDGIIGPKTWRRMRAVLAPAPAPAPVPPADAPPLGTFGRAAYEINRIVTHPAEASRWGFGGSLLSNGNYRLRIRIPGPDNLNLFRRYDFRDANKCNLFGLDMAWRAGFRVPVLRRRRKTRPYTYPLANMLTTYAERAFRRGDTVLRGRDGTQWGWMASRLPAEVLNSMIAQGHLFIITGWRRSGTGHVGIVGRVISKTLDIGPVRNIVYDGWEALRRRAKAVTGRRWRTVQCGPLTDQCQRMPGYCAIHLIGLTPESDASRRSVVERWVGKCRLV